MDPSSKLWAQGQSREYMWWLLWHQSECLVGCGGGLWVDMVPVRASVVGEVSGACGEMSCVPDCVGQQHL